jgi:hypothetical protein
MKYKPTGNEDPFARSGEGEVYQKVEKFRAEQAKRDAMKCVMCCGREGLSIVWSVSYGTNPDVAEQVVVCKNCRRRCDSCEQYRVEDEVTNHYDSATNECERCKLENWLANARNWTSRYQREQLARWKGADGPVAFQGKRLLEELKRAEGDLIAGAF